MDVHLGGSELLSFRNRSASLVRPLRGYAVVCFCQVASRKETNFLSSEGHRSRSAANFRTK